jgi:hypothetical protein
LRRTRNKYEAKKYRKKTIIHNQHLIKKEKELSEENENLKSKVNKLEEALLEEKLRLFIPKNILIKSHTMKSYLISSGLPYLRGFQSYPRRSK